MLLELMLECEALAAQEGVGGGLAAEEIMDHLRRINAAALGQNLQQQSRICCQT